MLTMKVENNSMGNCYVVEELHDFATQGDFLEQVTTIRLDDLYLNDISFMKVDVEGHEPLVISGAKETILRCRPLIWIESESQSFIEFLQKDIDYDTVLFDGSINYLMLLRSQAKRSVVYF
jgi:hypothetical protein